mmetsp:Transcript_8605/g.25887  ORF Transcript_8605/g.25887 Transcript_8605/m.25887 type:complete len:308 (+) Transcript_8605:102-1025(+)
MPDIKMPSAKDRYAFPAEQGRMGADDLRKRELAERKLRERDALLEKLKVEREEGVEAAEKLGAGPSHVYLAYKQNGGGEEDRTRFSIKVTLPEAWLKKPCARLVKCFAKAYNNRLGVSPVDPLAAHLAGPDGVLVSPADAVGDVVPHSGATLFVVDPTKLDARRGAAVSLHYKVECAEGVVVKASPKELLANGQRPRSFGVKGKWTCVEVALVKDGWLKLSRSEVDAYKGTHTFDALSAERGGDAFVECWMPAERMKPVIVNPTVADASSLVPVARVDAPSKKRAGLRPSERRALRAAGLDDSQILR